MKGKRTVTIEAQIDERDLFILQQKAEGRTAKEIAPKVFLSHRTVEARMDSLRRLLGAVSSENLIYKALKQGLIT
jgi:DNA-binding NarL/FixJ family response regulator